MSSRYTLAETTQQYPQPRSWLLWFLNTLVTTLIVLYVGFFALYQTLLLTPIGEVWWMRFYNIFGYLIYLPFLLFLPFLLIPGQRKVRSLALLVPLLFFSYEYGAAFVPKLHVTSVAAAQSDLPLRVMTWNAYFKNQHVENLVAAVAHENPDLLAVEEFGADYAKEFASQLKATYPYQLLYPHWQPRGYALLSRYPLEEILQPLPGYGQCTCIQANVTIQNRQATVLVIHPTVPEFDIGIKHHVPVPTYFETFAQDFQHETILKRIAMIHTPLLVMGDFNASDRMAVINRYRAILTDSFREAGWGFGFTFPYQKRFGSFELPALVRLDYIFHDNSWRAIQSWNGQASGSDHRYVVADLILKGDSSSMTK
ncbi:MAG: endonuclease/exonuclease/phosphatase family protein [Caldilineaceae bacterium]